MPPPGAHPGVSVERIRAWALGRLSDSLSATARNDLGSWQRRAATTRRAASLRARTAVRQDLPWQPANADPGIRGVPARWWHVMRSEGRGEGGNDGADTGSRLLGQRPRARLSSAGLAPFGLDWGTDSSFWDKAKLSSR